MDKASVALSATEDNAAAIRELNKKLTARTKFKYVVGTVISGATSFGKVTSSGNTAVIVVYGGNTISAIIFQNKRLTSTMSPMMAVLPEGTGDLLITGARNAFALIIG